MTAPAVLIRIPLEGAPRLLVDALTERNHQRIVHWIATHPEYLELVQRAIALEAKARAA